MNQTTEQPLYLDPSRPTAERVNDLLARMTLDEKISQMRNACSAIPRLGIPAYDYWSEALHGVARNGRATVFPQAIGMAATWDPDLVQRVGDAISDEGRAKYHEALRKNGAQHDLPGPDLLVAQCQHLPRPALGPRAGNLGRRPLSDR